MNSSITIERKRIECNALPKGWQREETVRKSGISAGKVDVYYYSPTGKRIETKPQLARHLGDAIDISAFDFHTGKLIVAQPGPSSVSMYRCSSATAATVSHTTASAASGGAVTAADNSSGNSNNASSPPLYTNANTALRRKLKTSGTATGCNVPSAGIGASGITSTTTTANVRQQLEYSRALRTDVSLVPPIRQTASIFKQPVTVVRNHEPLIKTKQDAAKHPTTVHAHSQEKPKQVFWEKRLERLRACHVTGEEFDDIALPKGIRAIGPNVNEQTVLQSLATALHVMSAPVTGQTSSKTELQRNATAFINPEQPLMHALLVSEDDIRRQEDRVGAARRKLQDALKS